MFVLVCCLRNEILGKICFHLEVDVLLLLLLLSIYILVSCSRSFFTFKVSIRFEFPGGLGLNFKECARVYETLSYDFSVLTKLYVHNKLCAKVSLRWSSSVLSVAIYDFLVQFFSCSSLVS